jgi:hypothetical protein
MTPARLLTTNRLPIFIGVLHVLMGVALALFLNHYIRDFSLLSSNRWYDSYWLPLWVASLAYLVEALFMRLPASWLYGFLLTAPPYGWHAALATVLYLKSGRDVELGEYVKVALPALLLALSGAVLNPVIAKMVAHLKPNRTLSPTE